MKTILLASQNLPQQIPKRKGGEKKKLHRQRRRRRSQRLWPAHALPAPACSGGEQHICLLVLCTQRTCPCFALFSIFYLPLIHKQLGRCKHVRDECRMYVLVGVGVGIGIDIGRTTHERPNQHTLTYSHYTDYSHTHTSAEQRIYRTRASRRIFFLFRAFNILICICRFIFKPYTHTRNTHTITTTPLYGAHLCSSCLFD